MILAQVAMNLAVEDPKTNGLKIKSKHFLIIFEKCDLARNPLLRVRAKFLPPIASAKASQTLYRAGAQEYY